ncbi:glycosyltransferase family 4 protein [Solirubrobacter phytolaccae]|uniref:Glycosyltransferase family 4 protein n=1 Tax=Solirubrobacter phytolaccae TaxID=1404360 RepID=A0A9X3S9H2_9ACTN|nr:glycosyltransferase family 4 protein [Solirubrobacter phytolaccae]MDA0179240.1 glycosyltransferase family 4 protein [Solirubrobacter phytolaccae]
MAKLEPGGAQLSMLRVMAELRGRGIASELLCGWASADGLALARRHGVEPTVWGGGGNVQWTPAPAFARWLAPKLQGADLVHAHMFGGWWAAAVATSAATPLVASEHNQYLWPDRAYPDELRAGLDRVDVFFAHGPSARDTVLAHGLPPERLREGLSPVVGTQDQPRAGLPTPRIVFAGRLHADKGPDLLLAALGRLRAPPVTLILGDGHLRPVLEEQVRELNLQTRVRFLGWVPDPGAYIAGAAALAIPSRDESFSQTAIIGLAHGVPVIGTDVDGFPTTLGDDRGIIVPPEDPDALAAALRVVLDGELPRPRPLRDYTDQFEPARVADVYEHTYRGLLSRGSVGTPVPA